MIRRYNRKNVTILILWTAAIVLFVSNVIFFGVTISQSNHSEYVAEKLDTKFKTSYVSLIDNIQKGEFATNKDDFTVFDAENAKHGYMIVTLFETTSYAENEALRDIVTTLNDYLGENRMHTDLVFPELSDQLLTDMYELSKDFLNEEASEAVKKSLYATLGLTP